MDKVEMKFLDWYLKISAGGALIGASMELFMIKTGFCELNWIVFTRLRSSLEFRDVHSTGYIVILPMGSGILGTYRNQAPINMPQYNGSSVILMLKFTDFIHFYSEGHMLYYAKSIYHIQSNDSLVYSFADDKVAVLESEKRAWESSPEAQAIRKALNPWRNHDTEQKKKT
ncbi:hypothetical protein DKX38_007380 [Salix brachista]|uniref:Uncharacterized protein n=1 Tax=Salix brachista TaxID=2182728 RepID=A0A5N5MQL6_9ROSI|nr:hypothetical protein DKX38_007380 [Salix brachista]